MSGKAKKITLLVSALAAVSALLVILFIIWFSHPDIYINEVAPSGGGKGTSVRDRNGDDCDWIELYNPSDKEQKLDGFSLCKNGKEKFSLDGFKIKAKGYLIVYCSKEGFDDGMKEPHADFNIPKTGEPEIALFYRNSEVGKVKIPQLDKNMTYSRGQDGKYYVSEATPGDANSGSAVGDTVKLSKEGGFYSKGFELTLKAGDGQKIYYTLDGTDPESSETRTEYTSPIKISDRSGDKNVLSAVAPSELAVSFEEKGTKVPSDSDVDKATVLRACAVGSSGKAGKTVTASYFVGVSSEDHNDLPIVSVVTDPESLFDYETGIYTLGKVYDEFKAQHDKFDKNGSVPANYNQRGREWERECHIEYYSADGETILSQDCGMRIQGGWSRAEYQKSFRFCARSEYGKGTFEAALWKDEKDIDGKVIKNFDSFILRNGGNDCSYSKFKDPMLQSMVSERLPETQSGNACVLFIDGEYWGLYTLTEDMSAEHFAEKYKLDEDNIVCVKSSELDEGEEEDMFLYEEMMSYVTMNSMSVDSNYAKACELIDMDNFIEYCAFEMYIFNTDWPQNNFGCWRVRETDGSNPYADGRWRFYTFDTESSCSHYNAKNEGRSIFDYLDEHKRDGIGVLIYNLCKNETFVRKLTTSIMKLGNMNFSYDNYEKTRDEFKDIYYKELTAYFKRFPSWANVSKATDPMIERMDTFFEGRLKNLTDAIDARFSPGELVTLSLDTDGKGKLFIDSTNVGKNKTQSYYSGSDLTLTAKPAKGWAFDHWEGCDGDSQTVTVTLDSDTSIKAVFKKA